MEILETLINAGAKLDGLDYTNKTILDSLRYQTGMTPHYYNQVVELIQKHLSLN